VQQGQPGTVREGLLYGVAAYGWWGLVPLYFKAVSHLQPAEVLAHRIVWSVVFLAVLLGCGRRWGAVAACLRDPRARLRLLGSTVLIAVNWFVYFHAVTTGQLVQASLGYFILPLVSVVLALLFLKERLRPLQWLAVALAAAGVLYLALALGQWPWIALVLAFSFAFYGLLRKTVPADGLVGLSVEVLLLLPAAAGYLFYLGATAGLAWGTSDRTTDVLILFSGVVTAVPLLCFGQAARRLPLATLGFLQYLSPCVALLLAVVAFQEELTPAHWGCLACIWTALALFSFDTYRTLRHNGQLRSSGMDPT
jgi:chloramphenicol-sensitive protein RarD